MYMYRGSVIYLFPKQREALRGSYLFSIVIRSVRQDFSSVAIAIAVAIAAYLPRLA